LALFHEEDVLIVGRPAGSRLLELAAPGQSCRFSAGYGSAPATVPAYAWQRDFGVLAFSAPEVLRASPRLHATSFCST